MDDDPDAERERLFAEAYDLIQADQSDVPFYVETAREAGSPVLELGSGTGRLLIPLARAGAEAVGLDASEAMLSVCRRKLEGWGGPVRSRVALVRGDMRDFRLDRRFRLILASCNTLNCLLDREDRLAVLRRCREHLAEGGRLVVESTVPDLDLLRQRDGGRQVFEFTDPVTGNAFLYRVAARCDWERRVERAEVVLEEYADGRLLRRAGATEASAFPPPSELEPLAREAGLRTLHVWKNHEREAFDGSARLMILEAA